TVMGIPPFTSLNCLGSLRSRRVSRLRIIFLGFAVFFMAWSLLSFGQRTEEEGGFPHLALDASRARPHKIALMKSATRMTSKGKIIIPKRICEQLRWTVGTQLVVEIIGDGVVRLTRLAAEEDPIDTLYGCLKDSPRNPLADLEAEHQAEIEAD